MKCDTNFLVALSIGDSRMTKVWQNRKMPWPDFASKCVDCIDTGETMAEYEAMDRDRQGAVKDKGGFVGGELSGGKRDKRSVLYRSMVCLDFDHVDVPWPDFIGKVRAALQGRAWVAYTTHKHRDDRPRVRLVVPFATAIMTHQYEPVARAICAKVGIGWADSTTYAPERLMYWPTRSTDAPFHGEVGEGDAATISWALQGSGAILTDRSTWPRGENEEKGGQTAYREASGNGRMPDPCAKDGIIGQFCRAHWPMSEAIEELLPGLYAKAPGRGRYTWTAGSTSGGALIYPDSDGKRQDCYLWSQHDTDPAKGMHNIFDLVRIHLFGDKDSGMNPDTPMCKRRSYLAMVDFAKQDPKTKAVIDKQNQEAMQAMVEAAAAAPEPTGKKKGKTPPKVDTLPKFDNTIEGAEAAIAMLLPNLWFDDYDHKDKVDGDLPWRKGKYNKEWQERDWSLLYRWLEPMGVRNRTNIKDAFVNVSESRKKDSLRDWLTGLVWDGNPRIEGGVGVDGVERRPMLTRWLGVADTELNRTIAKAFMVGIVIRGMAEKPVQMDYTLGLLGPEGIGKTRFCRAIGHGFYASCSMDLDDKDTLLVLHSKWLIEFAEIVSFKKNTTEELKNFLTRDRDDFRMPYEAANREHHRRCAFIATTNEACFINSATGMRQIWPVECKDSPDNEDLETLYVESDQILAEAVHLAKNGAMNWLKKDMEKQVRLVQKSHNVQEDEEMKPMLEAFLNRGIPAAWERMNRSERKSYPFKHIEEVKVVRNRFYAGEFVEEQLNIPVGNFAYKSTVRKINKLMEEVEGWERKEGLTFADYGRQKGWVRSNYKEPEAEDFISEL